MASKGSLEVIPNDLIGSFLVRILPYGPFPWKWSQAWNGIIFGLYKKPFPFHSLK